MSERARLLAEQFELANGELIAAVAQCTDAQWRAPCPAEGWSVGVTAHHVGEAHPILLGLAQGLADGTPLPPITGEMNRHYTATHAAQYADCGHDETVALLRRNARDVARAIAQLSDEQLDQASPWAFAGGALTSVQRFIERDLIGHTRDHLASITTGISRPPDA